MENEGELSVLLSLDLSAAKAALKDFAKDVNDTKLTPTVTPKESGAGGGGGVIPPTLPKQTKDATNSMRGLSQILGTTTRGVGGLMQGLAGMTKSLGAIGVIVAVLMKLFQGTDTLEAMKESFEGMFDALREGLAPVLAIIGDLFIFVADSLGKLLQPLGKILSSALKPATAVLQLMMDVLGPIIDIIAAVADAFAWLYDTIFSFIGGIFGLRGTSTTGTKVEGTNSALDAWDTSGKSTAQKIDESADSLNDVFHKITDGFTKLWDSLKDIGQRVWEGIGQVAANVWGGITEVAGSAWEGITNVAGKAWEGIKNFGAKVWSFLSGGKLKDTAGDIASGVGNTVKSIATSIGNAIKKLKFWSDGGTLGAQVWAMNERGNPEFVFNSGGYDSVINADALERAMYNALVRAGAGSDKELKLEVSTRQGSVRSFIQTILPELIFQLKGRV